MSVLARRPDASSLLQVPGLDPAIAVRVGFTAPPHVSIPRAEPRGCRARPVSLEPPGESSCRRLNQGTASRSAT
jgi:hypothetical protein